MANISVTYIFSNGSTSDATEVNTNYQDIIDGTTDGTKDFSISALTCAGTFTANGAVNLGNATSDDITITGRIASDIDPKTAATNTLGDATQTWQALYLDNAATDGGAVFFNASATAFLKSDASGADLDVGGFTGLDLGTAEIKRMSLYDEAKSADYTITDTDGVSIIYMTTSTTNRTVTLPTASANAGRVITVKKVDSATGLLTLAEEGTDLIDGFSSVVCPLINDYITVQCDGTTWHSIARKETSPWTSYTPSNTQGFGTITSVNLKYRRVGNSVDIQGEFTLGTSAASEAQLELPFSLTIATPGSSTVNVGYSWRAASKNNAGNVIATAGDSYVNFARILYESTAFTSMTPDNGSIIGSTSERKAMYAFNIPVTEWSDTA